MPPHVKPFFSYYGSKHRTAAFYPEPQTGLIVEPFAGSAAYACRYPWLDVLLVDANPIVCGVWDYLIRAPSSEVLALPLVATDTELSSLPIPQEARWLLGYWCRRGAAHPAAKPSAWMREHSEGGQFWCERVRYRIATSQGRIRHWKVLNKAHTETPEVVADWFVDPPYQGRPGLQYRKYGSRNVDYQGLSEWCRSRRGQIIVCENEGATWLPFKPFRITAGTQGTNRSGTSVEVVWHAPMYETHQSDLFAA